MFRLFGYLILFVFVVTLIRSVLGVLAKLFVSAVGGPSATASQKSAGPGSARTAVPTQGVLRKDPTCGIYVAENLALTERRGHETYYFCSEECRKKFLEERRKAPL